MSVNISFFCDVCDDREHVDAEQPSRLADGYIPSGWTWGTRQDGSPLVTCPACTRQ